MSRAFFITGTDTAVGKTVVAAALLQNANAAGLATLGLKPVAAGGIVRDGEMTNDDAWALMQLSSLHPDYAIVNPVALEAAIAPHIAAETEGVELDATALAKHCREQAAASEFCVIEGAGGWCVPLNAAETMADLAVAIGFPVIIVVGVRLGCINHSLLTAAAIRASGLEVAGWVANELAAAMPAVDANIATLEARLGAPLLGRIPWLNEPSASAAAAYLSLDQLEP